ncbi:hypothetical protein ACN94_14255 [Gordonia paraffinivorans]|uniref:hypothetical protein n=1 Tax=Gordonia paraffinivorans TaxID=175628 RepID=UPI000D609BAE|nr:hypothetical protein [Gordonia paraffinivorans]MBY4574743.1 hypothetical protein [Gordonia paraffinivorans]PWD45061.1 hypothetical protein ACN93_00170 [Gordonia paraffinivorans]
MTAAALTLFVLTALAPVAWLAADRATRDRHLFGLLPSTVASLLRAVGLVVLAGLASATAIVATAAGPATGFWAHAAPVIAAAAAVTGGGPIVRAVLALGGVRPAPAADDSADEDPESTTEVGPLRGGRVIGYLERLAVVSTLMAGWPEGLAIILAVKGLARYPELRAPQASEQFIMGTFVSVLWAIGMAGIEHLLTN